MTIAATAASTHASATPAAHRKNHRTPAQKAEQRRAQLLHAVQNQHASWFLPKHIFHVQEGAKTPRQEAWIVHHLQPPSLQKSARARPRTAARAKTAEPKPVHARKPILLLERTLVVHSELFQQVARCSGRRVIDRLDFERLLLDPKFEDYSMDGLLLFIEENSRQFLRKFLDDIDTHIENRLAAQVVSSGEVQEAPPAPPEIKQLGCTPPCTPGTEPTLRGRLIAWGPYRGQYAQESSDGLEQWFVAVDTDEGPRHVIGEDVQRALLLSGAVGGDKIRIIQKDMVQANVTEERHGSHGEGLHCYSLQREKVYDIYVDSSSNLFGAEQYRFGGQPAACHADATAAAEPHGEAASAVQALLDINPDGPAMRAVQEHIDGRTLLGWTVFRAEGQDAVHMRLLSCAPEDHVLLIVHGKDCVDWYAYREPLQTSRHRVHVRLPDLVIDPAAARPQAT